jgi:hypothetical protein
MLNDVPELLGPFVPRLAELSMRVKSFPEKVADRVQEEGHTMNEKVKAIRTTSTNTQMILNAGNKIQDFNNKVFELKSEIKGILERIRNTSYSDKVISRGIQGNAEGVRKPVDVIRLFWPIQHHGTAV